MTRWGFNSPVKGAKLKLKPEIKNFEQMVKEPGFQVIRNNWGFGKKKEKPRRTLIHAMVLSHVDCELNL